MVAQLPRFLWHTFIKHKQSALYDRQKHSAVVGRYVSFTPMWERTICGFRAGEAWTPCAASLLCRHINVIKNSDFLSSI